MEKEKKKINRENTIIAKEHINELRKHHITLLLWSVAQERGGDAHKLRLGSAGE